MTDDTQTHTLDPDELRDFDACRLRAQAKRDREIPPADAETVAAYAQHYDGDLRIFIHQLCEISSILGQPYDGHFDLSRGRFEWRDGAVTLLAGPGERTILLVDIAKIPRDPTGEALQEFSDRCSIRIQSM